MRSLFSPNLRAEVDDEIAFHLEMRARELAAGAAPDGAAVVAARERFGDVDLVREACLAIDQRRHNRKRRRELIGDLMQDVLYAIRGLRKSPAFTAMAIACVALGVAVTTTIFSAVHSILLRPLPYAHADGLVAVYSRLPDKGETGINISYPDYISWRDGTHAFAAFGMYTRSSNTISGAGDAEQVDAALVTASLIPTLDVAPFRGRTFLASEEVAANRFVVVLGYGLWQRRFGGDPAIVGGSITLDAQPYTVIGIMPPGFAFPDRAQLWTPLVEQGWMTSRGNRGLTGAIGRLKPGVSLAAAQSDLDVISKRLQLEYPQDNFGWDAEARSLRDDLVGDLRRPLLVLQGAVALVLLIACANVANLMLARGTTRRRDIAIRLALGAGGRRIAGHLFAESAAIALTGGLAGAALAALGVRVLRVAFPAQVPAWMTVDLDLAALWFALGVAGLTGVLFGLLPALRAARVDPNRWLRQGTRGEAGGGRAAGRLRSGLVVGEVALSLVLLVGATLLLRSYRSLTSTDLGFAVHGIMSARVPLPVASYSDAARRRAVWEALYARLAALPGVESVGSANGIPFSGWNLQAWFSIEGRPARPRGDPLDVHYQNVSPDYFRTIGVPLLQGRMFTASDRDTSMHIGVINKVLADREFPGEDPVGKRIKFGDITSTEPWITIIGVVGTYRHYVLPQPMGPAIYFPQLANASPTQTVVLRTSFPDPSAVMPGVRRVLHDIDPTVPAYDAQSFDQVVSRSLWRQRFQGEVLGIFAALALGLAVVGIYGVIAYMVAQRTRELGVRMALGARRSQVLRSVVGQGLRLAVAGVAFGIVGALALTRVVQGLLYGVSATDPATFVEVALALVVVASVASWIPALRATRVDPAQVLRAE
jgi:putative ABC transport system permease protein